MVTSYYRGKLDKLLTLAPDEGFMELLWAVNGIQSEMDSDAEQILLPFDRQFITTKLPDPHFVYKWTIETLANEKLTIPHKTRMRNGREQMLDMRNLSNAINAVNALKQLENSESQKRVGGNNILVEMSRIASQQFAWQHGYLHKQQFYRNTYIYGQGKCADHFRDRHGITVNQLSLIGFALFATLSKKPWALANIDITELGITGDAFARALVLLSLPFEDARQEAIKLRCSPAPTAYKKSLLRQYPLIAFGDHKERLRAPLPQLLLERVTSGIFYDVIDGGAAIRTDYGARFEQYSIEYLRAMLPEVTWEPEKKYKFSKNQVDGPDILGIEAAEVVLAIECKSTRMSFEARYGDEPLVERGYDDMVKAVYQLWKYFSHCRRGFCTDVVGKDAVGMVLTLDTWLQMAKPHQEEIVTKATAMAAQKDPEIIQQDRRPVMFTASADLELTLKDATGASFLEAVRRNAQRDRWGWSLSIVHDDFKEPGKPSKPFPFEHEFEKVLPWWAETANKRAG